MRLVLLALLSFSFLGLAQAAPSKLEVSMMNTDVILLDATGRSCPLQIAGDPNASDNLPSVKAVLGQFSFKWTGEGTFKPAYVKITFRGEGFGAHGGQTFTYSGQELAYIVAGAPVMPGFQPSETPVQSTSLCAFEVGGINIQDRQSSTYGEATFFIYGTALTDRAARPVNAETKFNYIFTGTVR